MRAISPDLLQAEETETSNKTEQEACHVLFFLRWQINDEHLTQSLIMMMVELSTLSYDYDTITIAIICRKDG